MQNTAKHDRAERDREVEAQIIVVVLYAHDGSCSRADLECGLAHIDALDLNDALARLGDHGAVQAEGERIEVPDAERERQEVDQLAAVVLHHLATASDPKVLSTEHVTREVERDTNVADEQREVDVALRLLVTDHLAHRRPQGWEASRAAVRANELSF
jgi:hypothetical protein